METKRIFVFGSNLAGRHGKGAALTARQIYDAELGVGVGPTGRAYAIPTKNWQLKPLALTVIAEHVKRFIIYARQHRELTFLVTRIGCGLAGYTDSEIAPMFVGAPTNCAFDEAWLPYLAKSRGEVV